MEEEQHIKNEISRTEEVSDIINRVPQRSAKIVVIYLTSFIILLLFLGFIIKYPESVSGVVTINAIQSPVRLTAPNTGRLHLLAENNEEIKEGKIVAYIESGVDIKAFFYIDSLMKYGPYELLNLVIPKSSHLGLGEITFHFLTLLNNIEIYNLYNKNNSFKPRMQRLLVQKSGDERLLEYLKFQSGIQYESKNILALNFFKDSVQYYELKSINEAEFLKSKIAVLNATQNLNSLKIEIEKTIILIRDIEEQIFLLKIEETEYEQNLSMNLISSYHELENQISQWKQRYAIIAPYSGNLEVLRFLKENTFLNKGEEVCALIPKKNPVMAIVLIQPLGAGKVTLGQEVIIRLDDFPYVEFGTITGKVKSISMLTNSTQEFNSPKEVHTYQVIVELQDQLKTNYGTYLKFKHDLRGVAQILVKKRKLAERLFDNLKYLVVD